MAEGKRLLGEVTTGGHVSPDVVVHGALRNHRLIVVLAPGGHGFKRSGVPEHLAAEDGIGFSGESGQDVKPCVAEDGAKRLCRCGHGERGTERVDGGSVAGVAGDEGKRTGFSGVKGERSRDADVALIGGVGVRDGSKVVTDGLDEDRGRELLVAGHFSGGRECEPAFAARGEGRRDGSVDRRSGGQDGPGGALAGTVPCGKELLIFCPGELGVAELKRSRAAVAQGDLRKESRCAFADCCGWCNGEHACDGERWGERVVVACEADAEALGGCNGGGCIESDEIVTLAGDFDGGGIGSAPAGVALVHAAPGALTGEDLAEPTGVCEEREPVIAGKEERIVGDHGGAVTLRAIGEAHRSGVMIGGKAVVVFDPVTQRGRRCAGRGP